MSGKCTAFLNARPLLQFIPLVLLLIGCANEEQRPTVYPVRGELYVNGQPAEGALLSLHPADGVNFDTRGSRPWSIVEADGSFVVSTYASDDGAPVGNYRVSVVWWNNPNAANPVDRLSGRFANPKQSQWHVQVSAADNSLEPHRIQGATLERDRRPANSADPTE